MRDHKKLTSLTRRLLLYGELRITAVYLVFGSLWILLSDRVLYSLVKDPELQLRLQTYKGWCFVAGTAVLYYFLLRFESARRRKAEADLLGLNAGLEKKVDERTRDLEAFSYSVSHDLRAPLRAIEGFSKMLEEDHGGELSPEGRRLLGMIRGNTVKQQRLLEAILKFSRAAQEAFTKTDLDMHSLAQEAWREAAPGEGAPLFKLAALPPAAGDRAMIRQVWLNLLLNAVKFTGKAAAPEISVSAAAEGAFNFYTVRDNGAGFDPAYGEKLFIIFQRLHRQDEFMGTGLGLAIASRVISRHGGRMWAEGEPGKGAAFHFSLPRI